MPVFAMLPLTQDSREPDIHLWGSVLRAYCDFLFGEYFYVNLYAEGIYYPPQKSDNPVFNTGLVKHNMELTGEIEPRFVVTLEKVTLRGGLSGRFFSAPLMNSADANATDQYCFSAGTNFSVLITDMKAPLEILVGYNVPIVGKNVNPFHKVNLTFRVYIPTNSPAETE